MLIASRNKAGPFTIIDNEHIGAFPGIDDAVDYARTYLKQTGRKADLLEISYKYKIGTKATPFRVGENEEHGYRIESGPKKTANRNDLKAVWEYCLSEAKERPFKIFLTL